MLSVQSPLQLAMPNDNMHDDGHTAWNAWRAPTNLPTPPSSVPPRRLGASKPHFVADHDHQQRAGVGVGSTDGAHQTHLTLPPIAHLDRHWPNSSPLTPPDDEMHASPLSLSLWRDAKPGPSRLHSPMTANPSPLLASPSPSPIDEDERYDERYDPMDEQQLYEGDEPVNQEWEWEWQQQQQQKQRDGGVEEQPDVDDHHEYHKRQMQAPDADTYAAHAHAAAADWVTNTSQRSAHFIAEKTCEMVCYLWFSSSLGPRAAAASRVRRERERSQRRRARDASAQHGTPRSPPFASRPLSNASTAALQFCASAEFVAFMAKLLATTQVSQSVIVLSLHYIFRLKERNDFTLGKPGSEFRVAVCALMLANKFVDDNTYTNKTWSDVSAIPLDELNKMEREFLLGVGFRLFVDAQTYDAWLNLLKGLVLAKEREHGRWRERRRARVIVPRMRIPEPSEGVRKEEVQQHQQQQRARSTSPHRSRNYAYAPAYPFTFAVPSSSTSHLQSAQSQSTQTSPNRPVSSKRTAADAFSPTSATFAGAARGGKRPTGLALDIRAALASAGSSNGHANGNRQWERAGSVSAQPAYTYADSLRGLERMSLATPVEQQARADVREEERAVETCDEEQTLAAPYRVADAARRLPPHLYFYTLASSPLPSPYAASAAAYEPAPVPTLYATIADGNASSVEELPAVEEKEKAYVLPQGAERKTRLRYVDSQAGEGYRCEYSTYKCGYEAPQSQAAYGAYGQQYAAPAPVQVSAHPSSAAFSAGVYAQSQPQSHVHHTSALVQQAQSQHVHEHQHRQHLPPLALALAMPPASARVPAAQTQSVCTSPLPGFAALDAYALPPPPASHVHAYLHAHSQPQSQIQQQEEAVHQYQLPPLHPAPQVCPASAGAGPSTAYAHAPAPASASVQAPAAHSAWSAPPSESVDGVYAPPPRYTLPHPHAHSHAHPHQTSHNPQHFQHPHPHSAHLQLPAPVPYKSYAPPPYVYASQPQEVPQDVTATGLAAGSAYPSHAHTLPERAAFANAGPPGVAHFYAYARPGSGSMSVYGGVSDANSSANSNGRLAVAGMVQQSQSVNASPNAPYVYGYEHAMRGRRF